MEFVLGTETVDSGPQLRVGSQWQQMEIIAVQTKGPRGWVVNPKKRDIKNEVDEDLSNKDCLYIKVAGK